MPFIQLQFRRDTALLWQTNNPTLAIGELAIETDTGLFKIGNGFLLLFYTLQLKCNHESFYSLSPT